jgi:osmoprotectant transport system permease protein
MSTKSRLRIIVGIVIIIAIVLLMPQRGGRRQGLKAAFDAEFLTRPDGYQGLSKCYSLKFASEPVQMDPGLMYKAIADRAVDVIDGFATDGRIPAYKLTVLKDDKAFFPPYYAAPLIRKETLEKYPELESILNQLAGRISDETMQSLNFKVDEKGRKAKDVAREFLVSNGLIQQDADNPDGSTGSITVGGKQFTEQEILGQIMAILIECKSNINVIRKLNLGGTMICFNALKAGDIDLYPEYTGTGLVNILKREVISDPNKAYDYVRQAFIDEYNLVWLQAFGFNNTYTLTMRTNHAKKLGIKTISDLANYLNTQKSKRQKEVDIRKD